MTPEERSAYWQQGIWVTGQGEPVPVIDMTDSHLENVVRFLCRQAHQNWECAIYQGYLAEEFLIGEYARVQMASEVFAMEYEENDSWHDELYDHPIWDHLTHECWKRKIDWMEIVSAFDDLYAPAWW